MDENSPIDMFSLIQNNEDITTLFYPMSGQIDGMCMKDGKNKIIGVNSTTNYGRQRFTVAHQLYHLFFEKDFRSMVCFIDLEENKDSQEKEANLFASYFLAPYEALSFFIGDKLKETKKELTIKDIIKTEQHFGMSRQVVLWRLVNDEYISVEKAHKISTSTKKLAYDYKLYMPTPEQYQYVTFGRYIKLAERLKNENFISQGKYEEILLSAFRSDIVYGLDVEEEEIHDG